jgi:transposase
MRSAIIYNKIKGMENYKWFMGIDVSKGKLDITLLEGCEKRHYATIENSIESIQDFLKAIKSISGFSMQHCLVCMEHTGIYNAHLLEVAQQQNWKLCLESAVQIKQSGGLQRGKNDRVDSYRIALYAFKNQVFLKLWQPAREVITKLRKLSAMKTRLIAAKKQLCQAIKEDKAFQDKKSTSLLEGCCKDSIVMLDKDIEKTEKAISDLIDEDEALKNLFGIIESVPGIGRVVATIMVITTNEFKDIKDARKYACYSGVAPFEHVSGSSIKGKTRTSKKANLQVKSLLHMASLVAARYNKELNKYYERKVKEGKNKMSVLNAVKNKLLHRIFSCVNENRYYEKEYVKKVA